MANEFRFLLYRFQQYNLSIDQLLLLLNAEYEFPKNLNKEMSQIIVKLRGKNGGEKLNLKEAEEELEILKIRRKKNKKDKLKFAGI